MKQRHQKLALACTLLTTLLAACGGGNSPVAATTPANLKMHGLSATYYATSDFTGRHFSQTDAVPNFSWGTTPFKKKLKATQFSAVWEGTLTAPYSETYTFIPKGTGTIKVYVDGKLVSEGRQPGQVNLTKDQAVAIRLEYVSVPEDNSLTLLWESPSQKRTVVPQRLLTPKPNTKVQAQSLYVGGNLLANSEFSDKSYWMRESWDSYDGYSSQYTAFDLMKTAGASSGWAKIGTTIGQYQPHYQRLPVEYVQPGSKFTLTARGKSTDGAACPVAVVADVGLDNPSRGAEYPVVWKDLPSAKLTFTSSEWTTSSTTFTLPNKINQQDSEPIYNIGAAFFTPTSSGSCEYDDIQLSLTESTSPVVLNTADFKITPNPAKIGTPVKLTAPVIDDANYWWNIYDPNTKTYSQVNGREIVQSFAKPGEYLAYASVERDAVGKEYFIAEDVGPFKITVTADDSTPTDDTPISPDLTYGSPIALEFPVFTADDTAYFDIYRLGDDAYTGKNFRWTFGDGSSATGDSVKHSYANPGTYTVTLQYENATGQTKTYSTQVAAIRMAKVVDKGARSDSLTAKFDAGEPIPGLTYEYTFQDKGGQISTEQGSRTSHTYAGVGSFDYTLTIRDNRAATVGAQGVTKSKLTAQATAVEPNKLIFQKTAWHTIWQRPPTAKLTWTGSDEVNAPLSTIRYGQSSTTVNFNGAGSFDDIKNVGQRQLTYAWDFGDGTTSTEANPVHVYNQTKAFLVTLTVTNKYGLKDTQKVLYHIRDFRYATALNAKYPRGTIIPQGISDSGGITAQKIQAQRVLWFSPDPTDENSEALFPWLLPISNLIDNGANTPITAGGENGNVFCFSYGLEVNGGKVYPSLVRKEATDPNSTFCTAMSMSDKTIGVLPRMGWNTIEVLHSLGSNRITADVFSHLVVPRLMVTVLPDSLIPGDQASPVITSRHAFNTETSKEELIVTVKVRESEVNDTIKLKIPVYAVNSNEQLLATVDGVLNTKFADSRIKNEPTTFINGVGEMSISLNPAYYGLHDAPFDLTKLTYLSSNNDCSVGDSPLARASKTSLSGCIDMDNATYNFPIANAPTSILEMPAFLQKSHPFLRTGHIIRGESSQEYEDKIREALDQNKRNTLEVVDLVFPILWNEHRKEYLDLVNRGAEQGYFTVGERLQLAAMGIGLVADATPVVHTLYKVGSKVVEDVLKGVNSWRKGVDTGSKAVVKAVDQALSPAATAGKLPEDAAKSIPPVLGTNTEKLLNECNSQLCYGPYDDATEILEKNGRTAEQARFEVENEITDINSRNQSKGYNQTNPEKMEEAKWRTSCKIPGNSFSFDTLVSTATGQRPISQLNINDKILAFNEVIGQEGYYPITDVLRHVDSSITTLILKAADGQMETITTTPEHPFYVAIQNGVGMRPHPVGHNELNEHWVGAGHLVTGDKLKLADGRIGEVDNVTTQAKTQEMFNLTVGEVHTFFVGQKGWLVHNTNNSLITCPGITHPKYGTMPKEWDNHTAEHIFEGEIEVLSGGSRNAVGWHFEPSGDPTKVRIDENVKSPDVNGVYRAKISVFDPISGAWIQKASDTTFFPRTWTPEKVMSEIEYALHNADFKSVAGPHPTLPGALSYVWSGRSREGILIKGFFDITNNRLISAFAVRGK